MNGFGKAPMGMVRVSMDRSIARSLLYSITALALAGIVLLVAAGGASADEIVWEYSTGLDEVYDADRLSNGNTLITDFFNDRVIEVDPDGTIVWEYTGSIWPCNADRLPNGNTLIAEHGWHTPSKVIEVDPDGDIVWEYNGELVYVENADRLSNGNTLICDSQRGTWGGVIEVDPDGTIVWEYNTGLHYPHDANRLYSGNTLIADTANDRVIEVDPDGDIVWEHSTGLYGPFDADRLSSGNTLICDLYHWRVIEVDSDGTIVWEHSTEYSTGRDDPTDADRLYSGNTLISLSHRVIEVRPVYLPDLVITEKSEEWVNPEEGTYNITYTVKNVGFGTANASKTGIYIDGVLSSTDDVPELELNTSYTSTVGPFTMAGVNDTIIVCADDESLVYESNEDNNCLENVAEIDLVITEKSEEWVNIGDTTYNIIYTVKNIGTIASGPCDAGIYIDGVFNRTVSTKALAPNEEETKTVGSFMMSDKSDIINVCADDNSIVPESDETNNCIENLLECTGCVAEDGTVYQCGDTVTKSCTFYGDMNCADTTKCGLIVGADNIVIDGAGYTLNGSVAITTCHGDESSPAVTHSGIINTGGYNDVMIKDVEIQNFCTGIVMGSTLLEKMTVTGCKIYDCGQTTNSITHGIHVVGVHNCTITKNEIYNISGTGSGCGGGGNGIFMFGGQQGDYNTITCNRIYDVKKTGIFMKSGCMHNYVSHNNIRGCPESGINPMCMMSNYNTYEYNNLSNNIGGGFSTGGSYNVLRFNTAHNNGGGGIGEGNTGNVVTNNTACGNVYTDIGGDICCNNTCDSGCGCDWSCNNLTLVYFDFDNDGHYSNITENCIYNNILGVGSCCNPGLFNASHAAMLNASGICWLVPGDDPNDCDPSIPDAKPDLVITEKSEGWISQEDKTYNITYTVKNIGNAEANESTTSIRIDGSEVTTYPVELLAPQATHTAELGPFTMSDGSDTIRACADNESVVIESNEDNNCKENIFRFHGKPDLVISKKYEEWVASNETYNTYTITYTIENIGTGDANESTTTIFIDGTEVATNTVGALGEGDSYTNTLGPFTMTGENDTIRICADNESAVDESNENNNCIENTFNYSQIGCVAEDGTLFRCGNTVTKSCTFNGDMTCTSGAGLIIGTNGITIDGYDHRMTGTTTLDDCNGMGSEASPCTVSGIYNAGFDNATIKNLEIENFCTGIALAGTGMDKVCNITVNNCNIHGNGFSTGNMATHGIHACNIAEGAPDDPALTITENEICNNEGTGAACGDGGNGIFIFAGSGDKHEYCNISHNRLHNNAKAGFWTKMMLTRSEIAHNEIWGNGYGTGITDGQRGGIILRCAMSNENLITYNDVHDNDVDGIFIGGSNNTIEYNNVTNNTDDGIDMGRSDGSYNNELYENTVCDNWDSDISTFGSGSNTTGDDNTCDTTNDYDDTGTAGCTYSCGGSAGVCGDVDGLPGVTTNDGRQIFMYLLHGEGEYPLADTWAADCDGLCDGITTNDGRQIFMYLLHGPDAYPLNCSC